MCGRFDFHTLEVLPERYGVKIPTNATSHYNTAPSQLSPVIIGDVAEMKRFGIKAPWNEKQRLINARAETVEEKPTFKKKFESQRCLIPANGFFEWKRVKGKVPYYFHVKGMPVFSLAGIYSDDGFAILTTSANKVMESVHDRMPVILDRDEEDEWLTADPEQALKLLDPFKGKLEKWEVSKLVNSPRNDMKAITTKV